MAAHKRRTDEFVVPTYDTLHETLGVPLKRLRLEEARAHHAQLPLADRSQETVCPQPLV